MFVFEWMSIKYHNLNIRNENQVFGSIELFIDPEVD